MKNYLRFILMIAAICMATSIRANQTLEFNVTGVTGPVQENVKGSLDNLQKTLPKPASELSVRHTYKKAQADIKKALAPFGYFEPRLQSRLTRTGNTWTAHFTISPGTPIRIRAIQLNILGPGQHDRAFKRLRTHFPLKVGEILKTDVYERAKQLLYDLASTRGYFHAEMLKSKIYINLGTHSATVVLHFRTGSRSRFGQTAFSTTPFAHSFLRKFLQYRRGTWYEHKKLEKTQEALVNSNYFQQVVVSPQPDDIVDETVPIHINLTPRKRYQYTLGVGYGTDTGPRGTLGFNVRRINRYGHRFTTLLQGAENNSNLTASYYIPGSNPVRDLYTFMAGYADFNQVTGNGTSGKVAMSYSTQHGRWQQALSLAYLNERYNIVGFPFTQTEVIYPSYNFSYLSSRGILHPKNGFSFSGSIAGTVASPVSDISFAQERINATLLTTLFNHTRLIFRTSLARTDIDNLENLPFSLQLFAGGPRSIRGYRYNAIGPGKNLFIGSFEIQQRIVGQFYLAGFIDAGNVTDDNPFVPENLFIGVGPGIAWLSPIGVLEITFANAITQQGQPWLIQFTMGPEL